ncbi:SIMPL domain-containing protein [Salinimicrobium marinum]|uniref:SIMPL domain-containing protein n=1 Tax=Salinimicrobium marinum TaxID=680283 RepID=A0A918VUC4_9FLAO|nr:SIMPL domain-containing protein [Salinimicrobium marinum]GHA29981.1 SIMPL domain-containing protein [Salinimicrobium marinum]
MKKTSILLAILFTVVAFGQQQQKNTVTVTGEGTVYVVPDKVLIKARIEHSGDSPAEVKRQNDEVVNNIFEYLESQDIPSENIRSEYINLNKDYDYNLKEHKYSANQAISIQLDDLKKYEDIMSGLLGSGLNRIDGVQFQTSRKEELKSEARRQAMLNSKKKANELAQALDQSIGSAVSISETESNGFQPVARMMEMKNDSGSGGQTIAPGEMEITVKVNVSFELGSSGK